MILRSLLEVASALLEVLYLWLAHPFSSLLYSISCKLLCRAFIQHKDKGSEPNASTFFSFILLVMTHYRPISTTRSCPYCIFPSPSRSPLLSHVFSSKKAGSSIKLSSTNYFGTITAAGSSIPPSREGTEPIAGKSNWNLSLVGWKNNRIVFLCTSYCFGTIDSFFYNQKKSNSNNIPNQDEGALALIDHRKFFDYVGQQLGIRELDEWYSINKKTLSRKDAIFFPKLSLLLQTNYQKSLARALVSS